jgi:peptide/nickel transport system substrate-binding protein
MLMRGTMHSLARIILACGLLALMLGGVAVAEITNPDTYIYVRAREPLSLDPASSLEIEDHLVVGDIYQRLIQVNLDNTLEFIGDAAISWEISEDGLAYTFNLREGLTFHNGNPITAEDVKYSIDRVVLNMSPTGVYLHFIGIVGAEEFFDSEHTQANVDAYLAAGGVEIVDASTIIVRTAFVDMTFLSNFTFWGYIVSKDYVEEHGGINPGYNNEWMMRNPMGSGPFQFVEWLPGQQIVLERFDGYWRGPAQLQYVVYKPVGESSTQLLMLQSGEADAILGVDYAILNQLYDAATGDARDPEIIVGVEDNLIVTGLMFNLSKEPYTDVKFREGLVYAFPYDSVYEIVDEGILMKPFNGVVPKGMVYYADDFPMYAQDEARAVTAFEEAGWTGVVTINTRAGRAEEQIVSLMFKDAIESLDVGITVDIVEIPTPTWVEMRRNGELEIYFGGWSAKCNDPHTMVECFYRSGIGFHASHTLIDDPVLDAWIDQAVQEPDTEVRAALYHDIVERGNNQFYYLPRGQRTTVVARRSWLKGWKESPFVQLHSSYSLYKSEN